MTESLIESAPPPLWPLRNRMVALWWRRSPAQAGKLLAAAALLLAGAYAVFSARFTGQVLAAPGVPEPVLRAAALALVGAQGAAHFLWVLLAEPPRAHRFADPAWSALPVPPKVLERHRRREAVASAPLVVSLLVFLAFFLAAGRPHGAAALAAGAAMALFSALFFQLLALACRAFLHALLASRLLSALLLAALVAGYWAAALALVALPRDAAALRAALTGFEVPAWTFAVPLLWPGLAAGAWLSGDFVIGTLASAAAAMAAGLLLAALRRREGAGDLIAPTESSTLLRGRAPTAALLLKELLWAARSKRMVLALAVTVPLAAAASAAYLARPGATTALLLFVPFSIASGAYLYNLFGVDAPSAGLLLGQPVEGRHLARAKAAAALGLSLLLAAASAASALAAAGPAALGIVALVLAFALLNAGAGLTVSARAPRAVPFDRIGSMTAGPSSNTAALVLMVGASFAVQLLQTRVEPAYQAWAGAAAAIVCAAVALRLVHAAGAYLAWGREEFLLNATNDAS